MAERKWNTFEKARYDVEAYNRDAGPLSKTRLLPIQIKGPRLCPAPTWGPQGQYQVAIRGTRAVIEKRLPGGDWVKAPLEPPP